MTFPGPGQAPPANPGGAPEASRKSPSEPQRDPLPPGAVARLGNTRFRCGGQSLAFSPDGRLLASGGTDQAVYLLEASTGKLLRRLEGHRQRVYAVAFSPDGKTLAALAADPPGTFQDMQIRVWDAAAGKPLRNLTIASSTARSLAFSPTGKEVIYAALEGDAICLREGSTGKLLREFKGHGGKALFAAFGAGGTWLVSVGADGLCRQWQVATGRLLRQVPHPERPFDKGAKPAVAFSPGGKRWVSTHHDRFVHCHDSATGAELWSEMWLEVGQDPEGTSPSPMTFSPDGRLLATVCRQGAIRLWDAATGKVVRQPAGHLGRITTLALSPDGRRLASAGHDRTVRLWDVASGEETNCYQKGVSWETHCLTFAPAGDVLAWTGWGWERNLPLWDPGTGKELLKLPVPDNDLVRIAFAPDGKMVAGVTASGTIFMWDRRTGKEVRHFKGGPAWAFFLTFAPDGKTLFAAGGEALLRGWDVATGKEVRRLEGRGRILAVALSEDRRLLAWEGEREETIQIWEADTGVEVRRLEEVGDPFFALQRHRQGRLLTFSPDGKTLALASPNYYSDPPVVRLFEVATGQQRRELLGHQRAPQALAWSADGRLLASGGWDCTVLVWGRTPRPEGQTIPLPAPRLETLWADLAGPNAVKAYEALCILAAAPRQAVPLLQGRLRPVDPADPRQINPLIAALDSRRYAERQKATEELAKLGEAASPDLWRLLADGAASLETRRRAEVLLQKWARQWRYPSPERLRLLRALEILERAGTPEARHVLEALARGASGARLTREARGCLERLARRAKASL